MELYANLHIHSTHSDGGYSPSQVARVCKEEGYKAIAITDHDIATAYPELKAECDKIGLECIFGAEFSSPSDLLEDFYNQLERNFHITAYHFDPEYPAMKQYLIDMGIRETEQTHVLFDRGVKLGLIKGIDWDEVLEYNAGIKWLCNMHLWRAMLDKGLVTPADRPWFWKELFAEHRFEVPPHREFKKEYEIIQLIRDAGGIAILAHPHEQLKHMDALIEMGVEGLEVWHGMMTEEEREQAVKMAYAKDLYISGGSDHRGRSDGPGMDLLKPGDPGYHPPMTYGTTKQYYEEIRDRRLNRW
jgi:predicted metal-dependent phosphoesterase TrpH